MGDAAQILVSVPLRGVGCFNDILEGIVTNAGFRPLAGCGLFHNGYEMECELFGFPSPCGVWVVSANA